VYHTLFLFLPSHRAQETLSKTIALSRLQPTAFPLLLPQPLSPLSVLFPSQPLHLCSFCVSFSSTLTQRPLPHVSLDQDYFQRLSFVGHWLSHSRPSQDDFPSSEARFLNFFPPPVLDYFPPSTTSIYCFKKERDFSSTSL